MSQIRNPFEHHHDHEHDHAHEDVLTQELDPAQQSLADALRVSFLILKIAMVALVVFYLFSNIFSVPSGTVAVRLRFGRIVGEGKERIIQPGSFNIAFPYPIEDKVQVPMAMQQLQFTREFWVRPPANAAAMKTEDEQAEGRAGPLDPEQDGSLLTGDANLIHARWSLSYHISDPLAYVENVGTTESAERIVRAAAEEGIVLAVAQHTADELIKNQFDRESLAAQIQQSLDTMKTGIKIEPKLLVLQRAIIPMPVRTAYEAVTRAESEKAQQIDQAQQERSNILFSAAGQGHPELTELIRQYDLATTAGDQQTIKTLDARMDLVFNRLEAPRWIGRGAKVSTDDATELWRLLREADTAERRGDAAAAAAARDKYEAAMTRIGIPVDLRGNAALSGKVAEAINDANSYRATAVTEVQREANIFQNWFNVYHGNPAVKKIVQAKLWQEAKAQILTGDVETIYLPPGQLNPIFNRDPKVTRKRTEAALKAEDEARKAEGAKKAAEGQSTP